MDCGRLSILRIMFASLFGSPRLDSTLRPFCFGTTNKNVGAEKFKRYEHALYILAEMSRIAYCDTGIANLVIQESLGKSPDIVNDLITKYDSQYLAERRRPATSQPARDSRPPESYALGSAPTDDSYGTYISTPEDCTCLIVKASKIHPNPYSVFTDDDLIITFKGTSSAASVITDIKSQFLPATLSDLLPKIGLTATQNAGVSKAFVSPILDMWNALVKAITSYPGPRERLFVTGHSLGGAYASLFGFILAENMSLPFLKGIKTIHIVTFGAPTCLGDNGRNIFNSHLDAGRLTLDRVVAQLVPSRTGADALSSDPIATIPVAFSHPGFRPLVTDIKPEAGGRPYSLAEVRKFYGVPSKTRDRDSQTWPFHEKMVGGSAAKDVYAKETQKHIPNFLSIAGHGKPTLHAEYLGMWYMGAFRLPGVKNPSSPKTGIAFFTLHSSGVRIDWLDWRPMVPPQLKGGRTRKRRLTRKR